MLLALLGREVPEMPAAWVFSPQECRLLETLQPRVAPETMGDKRNLPGSCPDYHQSPGRSPASKLARAARTPDPRTRAQTTARYALGTTIAQRGIVDDCCYREFCGVRVGLALPSRANGPLKNGGGKPSQKCTGNLRATHGSLAVDLESWILGFESPSEARLAKAGKWY